MMNWIRYRILMRRLRAEIGELVRDGDAGHAEQKIKSPFVTACNACGNIV